ncbi:MAG TPA: DUF2167 domain-containing protein [Longimicrobium sp.]|nr:DUF2167 domain-containing protein [Longimicrobium sp.]
MYVSFRIPTLLLGLLVTAAPVRAQAAPEDGGASDASTAEMLFASIEWQDGPDTAHVGAESKVVVPENCRFTGAPGARTFMVVTENPPSGNELGVLLCQSSEEGEPWFVVFSFDDSGYVRDDDAGELDADAILKTLQEGNRQGNAERRSRGWGTTTLTGWVRAPYYEPRTNNLTWATNLRDDASSEITVNHSVRLLGRGGVMHADLVIDPSQLTATMPEFDRIVSTHQFVSGRRYSEWREGDKLAAYGVTALVAGGAGAIAAKSGLLAKFAKFIWVGVLGALAWLRSLFSGRKQEREDAQ